MPKVKVARKSTAIDMTAMCDVAFLLLTFFILTATAKQPDPLEVNIPASSDTYKIPDKDIAILTMGKEKVFFEVAGQNVRENMIQRMGKDYNITFTPEEIKAFSAVASFGVPVQNLKQFLAMNSSQREKSGIQVGIPYDSVDNQLNKWILNARYAVKELDNAEMRIAIKGDTKEDYKTFRKIVDILQSKEQKINKFNLVTTAKAGVTPKKGGE